MTNEEAIEVLEQDLSCEFDKDLIEALEMAIKALKADRCYLGSPCEYQNEDIIIPRWRERLSEMRSKDGRSRGMTIREVINVLIDAPDKDKPFIVECRKDSLKNFDYDWGQLEITRIVNCPTLSVAEAESEDKE